MRLTKEKQERLIRVVVKNAYADRKLELQEKWNYFSEMVWHYFYQEYEDKMDAFPNGAFPTETYINILRVDESGVEIRNWLTIYFTKMKENQNELCTGAVDFHEEAVYVRRKRFYELNNP